MFGRRFGCTLSDAVAKSARRCQNWSRQKPLHSPRVTRRIALQGACRSEGSSENDAFSAGSSPALVSGAMDQ